jgi:phosphomannomutase / phosphoglucomutase
MIPSTIFRQYDIRGVVGRELTPAVARDIGHALASLGHERLGRPPTIAVGRDNRPSGPDLAAGVVEGIGRAGGLAVDVGELPTPALYFATKTLEVDGGIQVTGSHNPPEFNGFKMVLGGDTLHGPDIQRLRALIIENRLIRAGGAASKRDHSVLDRYVEAVLTRNAPLARPVKVAVDCGNGVTSLMAVKLFEQLGAFVVPLFCDSDGRFPNHHPDPTVIENLAALRDAVWREGAEFGIAFDGDGDRIGVVDEEGRVVFGDLLLVLFARDLVRRMGKGHTVIFDVKCSDVLEQELRRLELEPVMWKTGHSLIKEKIKETGAPLAGEMSGHMFFGGDYLGFDDAPFAAARLIHYVARHEGKFSDLLRDLPARVSTPELRVDSDDEKKFDVVRRAAEHFAAKYPVNTLDGVRITFPNGWGLLRASNTQPVLVLRFEAGSQDALDACRGEVEGWLRANP